MQQKTKLMLSRWQSHRLFCFHVGGAEEGVTVTLFCIVSSKSHACVGMDRRTLCYDTPHLFTWHDTWQTKPFSSVYPQNGSGPHDYQATFNINPSNSAKHSRKSTLILCMIITQLDIADNNHHRVIGVSRWKVIGSSINTIDHNGWQLISSNVGTVKVGVISNQDIHVPWAINELHRASSNYIIFFKILCVLLLANKLIIPWHKINKKTISFVVERAVHQIQPTYIP